MNWEVGIAVRVAGINVQELAVRCRAEGHQVPSTELCFGVGSCILKWLVGRLRYHIYHRRCKISLIGSLVLQDFSNRKFSFYFLILYKA